MGLSRADSYECWQETRHGHGRPGVGPVITQLRTGEVPACFLLQGVLFGGRPDRGRGVPASGPSPAARHVVADLWRQAGHYTTTRKRSYRLFPRRVFHSASDPTRGRFRMHVCSGAQTIASSPDLCKSGAESVKICLFSTASAQHNRHIGLNGVSPYSTDGGVLTKIQHLRG